MDLHKSCPLFFLNKFKFQNQEKKMKKEKIFEALQEQMTLAEEKAGYPPNCNDGYVAKDGKCVPVEKKSESKKNDNDEEKNGDDKKKNGNPFDKKKKKK